jgi:acetyl-CoA carboxylase carboxyl transferase subunit alpha
VREYLDFEKPLKDLEGRIAKLVKSKSKKVSVQDAITKSTEQLATLEQELFANLSPWQRAQIARHPQRPSISDYLEELTENVIELHGDRLYGEDRAIIGGFATWKDRSIMVMGHEKGKSLKERMRRNFGMAKPEGYRKALRLMKLAEKFQRPVSKSLASHEISGKVSTPYCDLYRHPRSLSWNRRRTARTGRSHRQEFIRNGQASSADHRGSHG